MAKKRFNVKGRQKVETIIDNSSVKQVNNLKNIDFKLKLTKNIFV